ncbi:MAG: DUF5320 domain-containing protein [Bacteroidales bacterium]|nr:DUF5320 domain-containing protein [Bacteroidales bacterium]
MPQGDRTGPMGQGPRTGRALGFCSGYDSPGYTKGFGSGMGRGFGFGYGRGMGRGRGYGRGWHMGSAFTGFFRGFPWMQPISKEDEISMLKSQAEELKRSQENIEKRLTELEKEGE